ncbi:MAG: hypothetical protein JNL82_21420 [Myxococcales bacterium]|nr:hypothetical protein [Myxococcales bacterium]
MVLALVGWLALSQALVVQSAPIATPTPAAAPVTTSAPTPAPAPPAASQSPPPDTQPVVRAAPGNWGMTFIFGGLAPLSLAGSDQSFGDGLLFTEIGVRRVFKRFVLPFSFGAGVARVQTPGQATPATAAGISASVAILKGFRVWRRIAPYFGAFLHTHYVHPPGPGNYLVNISVGPILGIEYFIADRVSLYGQGVVPIGPDITRSGVSVTARTAVAAGGQLGLTFYF